MQLYAQATGRPKRTIFPSSKDEFYCKEVDVKMKFVTYEKGKVIYGIFNQNGQQIEAKKLIDETPVNVDPAVFDKYIGKYDAS